MNDRLEDECPECGKTGYYWPKYGFFGCPSCGFGGAVDVYPCPYCSRYMVVIGKQAFCLGCKYEATAGELAELEIAEHDDEKAYYKSMMEQPGTTSY